MLSALSWKLQAAAIEEQPAGFAGLCEPVPLRPQRNGASLLSLFSYDTGAGAAEAYVDRGLLTIVSSAGPGLELRTFANSWRGMQLHHGEVVVLAGATLAAASGQRLQAAVHRVGAQQFPRSSVVMRLRGSPDALLPRMSVAQFEQMFQESHPVSVNRNGGAAHGTRTSAGNDEGGSLKRRRSAPPVKVEQLPPPQAAPPPQLDDGSQISLRIRDQVRFFLSHCGCIGCLTHGSRTRMEAR